MPGWVPPQGMAPAQMTATLLSPPTCGRCGFYGAAMVSSHGGPSGCLAVVLLCCGVLPGLLYLFFTNSVETRHCPQCGAYLGQSSGSGCVTALVTVAVGSVVLGLLFFCIAR